jgi:hypothetical protein
LGAALVQAVSVAYSPLGRETGTGKPVDEQSIRCADPLLEAPLYPAGPVVALGEGGGEARVEGMYGEGAAVRGRHQGVVVNRCPGAVKRARGGGRQVADQEETGQDRDERGAE